MEIPGQEQAVRRDGRVIDIAQILATATASDIRPIPAKRFVTRGTAGDEETSMFPADRQRPKGPQQTLVGDVVLAQATGTDWPRRREVAQNRLGIAAARRLLAGLDEDQGRGVVVDGQRRDGFRRQEEKTCRTAEDWPRSQVIEMGQLCPSIGEKRSDAAGTFVAHGLGRSPEKACQGFPGKRLGSGREGTEIL